MKHIPPPLIDTRGIYPASPCRRGMRRARSDFGRSACASPRVSQPRSLFLTRRRPPLRQSNVGTRKRRHRSQSFPSKGGRHHPCVIPSSGQLRACPALLSHYSLIILLDAAYTSSYEAKHSSVNVLVCTPIAFTSILIDHSLLH